MNSTLGNAPQVEPPDLVIEAHDPKFGRIGYVVIDRPVRGSSCGGVRYGGDTLEGLCDIARAMTFKWGWLNVPMGGAKGWITADIAALSCTRSELMRAYGRAIRPLVQRQVYIPGVDLGTTNQDLAEMLGAAGAPLTGEQIDASSATAMTVFESIRAAAAYQGKELPGLRVAIEGFGKVATGLAQLLAQAGACLTAVSTVEGAVHAEAGLDAALLLALKQQYGDSLVEHVDRASRIPLEDLLRLDVDVLVPGAVSHSIHAGNADDVRAAAIVPIANAPITREAEQRLAARGVLFMPDFVSNCGGVFASDANGQHFHLDEVQRIIRGTYARAVAELLRAASRAGMTPAELARGIAWDNHTALEGYAPRDGGLRRLGEVWREQGSAGLRRRLAWRAYNHLHSKNVGIRSAALERYDEFHLGVTLEKLIAIRS